MGNQLPLQAATVYLAPASQSAATSSPQPLVVKTPNTVVAVALSEERISEVQLDDVLPHLQAPDAVRLFADSPAARGVVEATYPFRIRYVNPAWCRLCQFDEKDTRGHSLKILQGALTDKQELNAMIDRLKAWHEKATAVTFNYTKKQTLMRVKVTSTQLQVDGRPGAFYSFKLEKLPMDLPLPQPLVSPLPWPHPRLPTVSPGPDCGKVVARHKSDSGSSLPKRVSFFPNVKVVLIPTREEVELALALYDASPPCSDL